MPCPNCHDVLTCSGTAGVLVVDAAKQQLGLPAKHSRSSERPANSQQQQRPSGRQRHRDHWRLRRVDCCCSYHFRSSGVVVLGSAFVREKLVSRALWLLLFVFGFN